MDRTVVFISGTLIFFLTGCSTFNPKSNYGVARSFRDLNPLPPELLPMWKDGLSLPKFPTTDKSGGHGAEKEESQNSARKIKKDKDKAVGSRRVSDQKVDFWKRLPWFEKDEPKKRDPIRKT